MSGAGSICEWFARCDRPAFAFVAHPVLGQVPTCRDCITHMGLSDRIVSPIVVVQT